MVSDKPSRKQLDLPLDFGSIMMRVSQGSLVWGIQLWGTLKNSVFQRALWIVGETLIRSC